MRRTGGAAAMLLGLGLVAGCAAMSEPPTQITPPAPEAYSLFGEPLGAPRLSVATRESLEARLAQARLEHDRNPDDAAVTLRLARRMMLLGRFRAAVAVCSDGLARHPDETWLHRERARCYVALRRFESAVGDLDVAARRIQRAPDPAEPVDLPPAPDEPARTLHSGIWYDLGLACHLTGDFTRARDAWERCLERSSDPDARAAATFWLWQSLARIGLRDSAQQILGRIGKSAATPSSKDYLALLALYRGEADADTLLAGARRAGGKSLATVGYGVASWRLARGERVEALALLRAVVKGDAWAVPGHIAAEVELQRLGEHP